MLSPQVPTFILVCLLLNQCIEHVLKMCHVGNTILIIIAIKNHNNNNNNNLKDIV